jgi:hypothetical protein
LPVNFPTSLDVFTNPASSDATNSGSVPHATQHSNANDAIEALEARVGIVGSADAASLTNRIATLEAMFGAGSVTLTLSQGGGLSVSFSATWTRVQKDYTVTGGVTLAAAGASGSAIAITGLPGNPVDLYEAAIGTYTLFRSGVGYDSGTVMLSTSDTILFRSGGAQSAANPYLGSLFALASGDYLSFKLGYNAV